MSVESAAKWMEQAAEDLDVAEGCIGTAPGVACYLSQQCIEKSLKAILVFENIPLEYTHELGDIHDTLPQDWSVTNHTYEWKRITEWAITGRYPTGNRPTMKDSMYGTAAAREIYGMVADEMDERLHRGAA